MKGYQAERLRNVGIIGHGSSGKTTLTEALLFSAGAVNRLGRVEDGTTTTDYNEDEISRKITIGSALAYCQWEDCKINLLDTPGYVDFLGDVKTVLSVLDSVIVVLRSAEGVEVGTEKVWQFASEFNLPRLLFINRMDHDLADFERALSMARERFGNRVTPLQLPIGSAQSLRGIIDLVTMRAFLYNDLSGAGPYQETEIPEEVKDQAEALRQELVENTAETDEELMERYFEEGDLSQEELLKGLRKGVLEQTLYPLLCGAVHANVGGHQLLGAIVDLLPSPLDRPPRLGMNPDSKVEELRHANPEDPFSAVVFKTISEPHVGEMSFFRVFSGTVQSGSEVYNGSRNTTERIGQIYLMRGKNRTEIEALSVGEIGAVVKLKNTHTGDSLCHRKNPIVFPKVDFDEPVTRVAIIPRAKGDEEKIGIGLARLHEEDPTFSYGYDNEIKQTILAGAGELHLEVIVDRLKNKFGVEVDLAAPRIPYKETIRGQAEAQGKYKKQTGGRGQYGDAWLRVEPLPRGAGFDFEDRIVGGVIPNKFIPAVEKGVREAMEEGVLAGYPVVDIKVAVYDGSYHSVDSSEMAFKIAASMGFKKAFLEAQPVLIEPIMEVEVTVPEECMGDVMGDLSSRRGRILGMSQEGHLHTIKAEVPLAELYKYSTLLRSLTHGRGLHTRKFSRYEQVPKELSDNIIAQAKSV